MRWFTSDQHFGHARICELAGRPFDSVEEMNETLIHNWNERVGPSDTVYVLGDFAMGTIRETLPIAWKLHGFKYLIPGNHDRCGMHEPNENKRRDWARTYHNAGFLHVWQDIRSMVLILDGDIPVTLSHYPYDEDYRGRTELEALRPIDTGGWLLHGHVHEKWGLKGRQINVGVDVRGFAPMSEDEVATIIKYSAPHT